MIKEGDFVICKPGQHREHNKHDIPKGPQQVRHIYGILISLNKVTGLFDFSKFDKFEWFEKGDK